MLWSGHPKQRLHQKVNSLPNFCQPLEGACKVAARKDIERFTSTKPGLKNIQLDTHLIAASLRKVGGTTKTVLPGGAGTSENSATGPHKFEKLNLAHEVRCLPTYHLHLNVSWKKRQV